MKHVRVDEQRGVMEQIVKDGVCPFCMENFTRYHKKPILRDGKHWVLTANQWPYKNTKHHLLAVAKKHIETLAEITPAAAGELLEYLQWAEKEYGIAGGSFFMRFGIPQWTGATVSHLHAQLVVGDHDDPKHEPVRVKLG